MPRGIRGSVAPHGTLTRYTRHGCRCDECRAARRTYERAKYGRKSQAQRNAACEPAHGTEGRYVHRGCRCEDCTRASREARATRRARRACAA